MSNIEQFELFCRYILWKGVVDREINFKVNIVYKSNFTEPSCTEHGRRLFFSKRKAYSVKRKAGSV